MNCEIERKYLVASETWRDAVTSTRRLRDGLLARFEEGKVRVRVAGPVATITIKGPRTGLSRAEYEYEIPRLDAEEILNTLCHPPLVEKTRHYIPHDGLTWVVDVYEGTLDGLVLAEVELEREDQTFALPSWVGREVTGDPRFSKGSLAKQFLPDPKLRSA
ncbi:CYTH domain-containing protein [Hyphomicrobium facile]|uniref:CYTH domain-containing protein n=1 Tax=Hyphomicrobium facile TaxID=51670 RepID=A0A1I7MXF1_9HYPH|nr:CYTH domain-containing protein [Hyphomicrobium facile]SFV27109.1 CYTH domain-containing protein [Hyphomicrobium facile]